MDDDLKQVLEAIREESAAAHAETRRQVEVAQAETLAKFDTAQVENAAAHAETRRQMGVLAEAQQYKLDLVIERVLSNGEKIDQLDAKFGQITSDLDTRVTRLEVASARRRRI